MDGIGELLLVRTAVVTAWRWNTSLRQFLRQRLRRASSSCSPPRVCLPSRTAKMLGDRPPCCEDEPLGGAPTGHREVPIPNSVDQFLELVRRA